MPCRTAAAQRMCVPRCWRWVREAAGLSDEPLQSSTAKPSTVEGRIDELLRRLSQSRRSA